MHRAEHLPRLVQGLKKQRGLRRQVDALPLGILAIVAHIAARMRIVFPEVRYQRDPPANRAFGKTDHGIQVVACHADLLLIGLLVDKVIDLADVPRTEQQQAMRG